MKAYPKYKDSGAPWLGDVPEHWEAIKTKHLFSERVQKGYPNEPLLAATQTKGVVPKSMYENRTVEAQKDLHLLKLVEPGDFVISLRSFQGGIEYAYYRGIISPAYTVMIPNKRILPAYYRHLAKSKKFISLLQTCVTGIREGQNINYEILRKTPLPVPTEDEQQKIFRYLDWQTSKINKFIKAKKKLITLLKEQKQNVINEAVTKGINPDVKMKDSGVESLGEIPAHWEVSKNKAVYSERREAGSEELPILSVSIHHGVSTEEQNEKENLRAKIRIQDREKYLRVYPNDIAFNMMRAWQGGIGVVQVHGMVSPAYIVAKPKKEIHSRFVELLFRTPKFVQEMDRNSRGITDFRKRLYWDQYKNIFIVLPPIDEQKKIVEHIDRETALIDKTISRTEREIELIQEYRTRLISDVVTGKIDVRSVESPDFEPVEADLEAQHDEESEDELITEGIEE